MLALVLVEKSIITVILLRYTTLGAFFLSLNSYEVYEFKEFSLWSFSSKPVHNDLLYTIKDFFLQKLTLAFLLKL